MIEIGKLDWLDDFEVTFPIEMFICVSLLVGIGIGAWIWYVRK